MHVLTNIMKLLVVLLPEHFVSNRVSVEAFWIERNESTMINARAMRTHVPGMNWIICSPMLFRCPKLATEKI